MTFEQCKDQVAKDEGLDQFPKLPLPYQALYEKAAELYADSKAREAFDAARLEAPHLSTPAIRQLIEELNLVIRLRQL